MKAFSARLFQPFSTAIIPVPGRKTERCDSLPQGNSARLISKTILHLSPEGPGGIKVAAGSWGAGVSSEQLSCSFTLDFGRSHLPPFPVCSTSLVSIPRQKQASGCLAEGAQYVKTWGNLQGFGWKICRHQSVGSPSPTA